MANDADNIVIGSSGSVWVASTSAQAPTTAGTALGGGWTDLGFVSEDGATFTQGMDITDIGAWQSFFPVRRIITARSVQVAFALREWKEATLEFALGGTVAANSDEFKYTPPDPEDFDQRSLCLEWADGTKAYRLYIPVGIVSEAVETTLARTAAADLPVTFAASDPGAGKSIYTLFIDDSNFTATSS